MFLLFSVNHSTALTCLMSDWQVDLIWVNREQKSFEWFVGLLRELELEQPDDGENRMFVLEYRT